MPNNGYQKWQEVFQNPKSCAFDEWAGHAGGGVAHIFTSNGKIPYNKVDFANLDADSSDFRLGDRKDLADKKNLFFKICEKKCLLCDKSGVLEELIYVHFQKRNLLIKGIPSDEFFLLAPCIVANEKSKAPFFCRLSFAVREFKSKIRKLLRKIKLRLFRLKKYD